MNERSTAHVERPTKVGGRTYCACGSPWPCSRTGSTETPRTEDPFSDPLLKWHHSGCAMRMYRSIEPYCDCGLTQARRAIEARAVSQSDSAGLRAARYVAAAVPMPRVFAEGPPEMAGAWSAGKAAAIEAISAALAEEPSDE